MWLKIIQDHTGTNKKSVCDFQLMNTNLYPILYPFQDIADCQSNLRCQQEGTVLMHLFTVKP